MRRIIAALAALILAPLLSGAQTYTGAGGQIPISGSLRSAYPDESGGQKMVSVVDLDGAFVQSATVSGSTLTLTVQHTDNTSTMVTFTDTGGSGGSDGVLDAVDWDASSQEATFETSLGGSFTLDLSGLAASGDLPDVSGFLSQSQVDGRIATYARISPTGQIADAQMPAAIARDSEVDAAVDAIRDGLAVLPDADGNLPDAVDNQGRFAVSGNQILTSIDHGGHDKSVTFKRYGTRTVLTGEPAKTTQESNYQGAFNSPPDIGVYDAGDLLWDRGSQIWLWKQNQNDATWRSFGGPVGYAHGSLYSTEAIAANHVGSDDQVGKVYIIGTGSGQHVYVVTAFSAATDDEWRWDPLGVTLGDVQSAIAAHNEATDAHDDIRTEIGTDIAAHNTSGVAHQDIRSDVSTVEDRLDALDGVEIEAYSSTATYARGSANSIVTHSNGLFIYISSTERSSGHDPDTQPGYWLELSEGVAYEVITTGSHRIAARTLVVDGVTDQVYLCTTTQTTPRDLTYIKDQAASIGGTFIELTAMIPTTWKGPHVIGQDYEAGDRVTTDANTRIYTARVDTGETPPHADWIQTGPVGSGGGVTLRQGSGAPGSDLGDDGDWYLRTSNGQWYEKVSGAWVSRYTDMVGEAGSGITETQGDARYARQSENLSDLDSAATARTNLGLGSAAEQESSAFLSQDGGDARYLNEASNLSDLPNAGTARTNLGLGTAATRDTGTGQNNVPILDASGDVDAAVIPIDNTLQVDGSGDLGVNTQRVVQTVSEWVQHFATGDGHDTSGHSGKYQEYTSPNTVRRIGSVQYDFDPLNDSSGGGTGKTYQVFIIELTGRNIDVILGSSAVYSGNSLQHRFHFTDGVLINPNVRIGIGLHRTDGGNNEGLSVRAGAESQDSPRESYDDASDDFNFLGRFNHDRPTPSVNDSVGGTSAGQIYGNPEIFYQIIHTHASLVGDGTVSADHISSGSAALDEVLKADGSGGSLFGPVVVHGSNIVDNTIPTAKYGNLSVTGAKLADAAVTTAKMDSGSATDGHVLTADGSGGVAYEAAAGGGGSNDGVVDGGSVSGTTLTLTRTESLDDVTITGLPSPGGGNPNATRILTGATWDSGANGFETFTATGWRNCDFLFPVFKDSSESAVTATNTSRPYHGVDMAFAAALDADGSIYLGVSQNEGTRIYESTGDDLIFLWVGNSPAPGQGDSMDLWCLDAGGSPGDEAEDTSVAPQQNMFVETSINVPTSTWGYVNFGDIGSQRLGEWHRFLIADLTGLTDGTDNGATSDANALMFVADEETYFFLGKTSGDVVLVGSSSGEVQPGTVRIRSN